jgi:protein TonB
LIRLRLRLPTAGRPGLGRFVGLSLAAHAAFVLIVVFMPSLDARTPVPDHVVVELVPVGDLRSAAPPAADAAPAPPEPDPEPAPPEKAEPVPIAPKKVPDKLPAEPVEKKPPRKKETTPPKNDPPKEPPKETSPAPGGSSPATGQGKEVGDARGGVASLEGGDLQFAWYRSSVTAALHGSWRKPALDGVADSFEVTVAFDIRRDGAVEGLRIEIPSGIQTLDRSALRAVLDAAPLPPLPRTWDGDVLPARFVFRLYPE